MGTANKYDRNTKICKGDSSEIKVEEQFLKLSIIERVGEYPCYVDF